jgi:hypothetical protein
MRPFIQPLQQVLKRFLIGWGACSLAAHAGHWLLRQPPSGDDDAPSVSVDTIPSPDGRHLLELAYASGDGAAAACHDRVTIKSLDAVGRIVAEEHLYSAPCSPTTMLSAAWIDGRIAITAAQHGGTHQLTYRNVTATGLPVTLALQ